MKPERKGAEPFASVLIVTRDRPDPLLRCLGSVLAQAYDSFEVLVLDDCSQRHHICTTVAEHVADERVECLRSEKHTSYIAGRNSLMRRARGEILVFLDDDAWFENDRCLERVVNHFSKDPRLGAIAFKIIMSRGQSTTLQVPFSRLARRRWTELVNEYRLCSYYVGAGHALRRAAVEQCGLYQEDYMFYLEELDLAYRMIQGGFHLLYAPDTVVHHLPEPSVLAGDKASARSEFWYDVRNRIWFAYKYLPFPYLFVHVLVWLGFHVATATKDRRLSEFVRGACAGVRGLKQQERSALSREAVAYLKANFGRLWY